MRPKSSLRLSLYAGLTSLVAMLLYQASESFIALPVVDKLRRVETIALVSVGVLVVIEPLLSQITISRQESVLFKRREGLLVRMLALAIIVLVSICDGLLHEYLGETISPRGWLGVAQLVSSLIGPSVITFFWLQGLRTAPPRARTYGLYAAISIGVLFFIVDAIFSTKYLLQKVPVPSNVSPFDLIEIWSTNQLDFSMAGSNELPRQRILGGTCSGSRVVPSRMGKDRHRTWSGFNRPTGCRTFCDRLDLQIWAKENTRNVFVVFHNPRRNREFRLGLRFPSRS